MMPGGASRPQTADCCASRGRHRLFIRINTHHESASHELHHAVFQFVYALSMLFAAPVFGGGRLAAWIRALMIASGVLSLAGLSGVVTGEMQLRNIGIVGYVGVFLFVAALLAILFYRSTPKEA